MIREYIYLGNYRIAMAATRIEQGSAQPNKKQSLQLHFVHNDHLGTPNKITDASQRVVWSMEQTPFGEVNLTTEAIQMPMRFPGQYADLESGLNYNYFRDYDASIGRYVQSDPIGLNGGVNTFSYVSNNPLNYMDLFGNEVRIRARYLNWGKAAEYGAHTAIVIEVTGFSTFTYASFNENDSNVVQLNPPTDHGETALPMTDEVVIPPPEGMTQLQWDLMVLQSAEHVLSSPLLNYEAYPDAYQAEGNCHTTTRRIIEGAGGFIPQDFSPPGEHPDLHPGEGR